MLPIKALVNHPTTRLALGGAGVIAGVSMLQALARERMDALTALDEAIDSRRAALARVRAEYREARAAAGIDQTGPTVVDDVAELPDAVRAAAGEPDVVDQAAADVP